jgi:hypothetical protein
MHPLSSAHHHLIAIGSVIDIQLTLEVVHLLHGAVYNTFHIGYTTLHAFHVASVLFCKVKKRIRNGMLVERYLRAGLKRVKSLNGCGTAVPIWKGLTSTLSCYLYMS